MDPDEILACSISVWYPLFKNVTIKSRLVPITEEVKAYLGEDGVVLPSQLLSNASVSADLKKWFQDIEAAISQLGGEVFPKLNWSSPKDASWIALGRTLKCQSADDVCLLLKSSDFISHDLQIPFEGCENPAEPTKSLDYCLVLKQWRQIDESLEFRVFIKNKTILGNVWYVL